MEKRYLTTKEVAIYLGLSEHTIRAWVKLGRIPFYKLGRAVRFDLRKLEPWLKRQECSLSVEDFHLQR
ncbi:MAG: helix-turn-helix domain-containing protein [Candidatus Omnitrophota bacterium]